MERKLKFTKANTAAVKGIAIIFLILYHGFSIKSRLYGYPVSFWPLSETTAMAICRVMVQCVGIFAFLSVYGLTLSMKAQYQDYEFTGHEATLFVLKRYVKLVLSFTIPFLFCMGVTYLTHTSRYSDGFSINLINAGILPLTFVNEADYDKIEQGDQLELTGIRDCVISDKPIVLKNITKGLEIPVNSDLPVAPKTSC